MLQPPFLPGHAGGGSSLTGWCGVFPGTLHRSLSSPLCLNGPRGPVLCTSLSLLHLRRRTLCASQVPYLPLLNSFFLWDSDPGPKPGAPCLPAL